MRTVVLDAANGGINRQRIKGGAAANTFYDIVNGYVDSARRVLARPGFSTVVALPPNAKGLCAFQGVLHTFVAQPVTGWTNPLVVVHVLRHPNADDSTLTLKAIHFAAGFIGFLYVVAEFSNGDVYHYWLQQPPAWQPNQQYNVDTVVQPTVPNGLLYKITNNQFPQAWQANQAHAVNDVIVPTVLNGWKYTCIEADGAHPASGATEPTWPTSNGATVTEEQSDNPQPPATPPASPPPPPPGGGRYGNPAAGGGGGGGGIGGIKQL